MSELLLANISLQDDKKVYNHIQDVSSIYASNREIRAKHSDENWNKSKNMKQVASVPTALWLIWESCGITADQNELKKALNRHKDDCFVTNKNI